MPAGLLIGALNWLASHLIVITLAGFVAVGLWVFGVIGSDSSPSAQGAQFSYSPQDAPAKPERAPQGRKADSPSPASAPGKASVPVDDTSDVQSAKPRPTAADQGQPPTDMGMPRKQPKMIGGSLPIYDVRPRLGGAPARESTDGFRPPSDNPPTAEPSMTREQGFERARRAFWNGDFEAAESAYMDLITNNPGDPDAYGELGNLYESMGKPGLAADAFYEAGSWLKRRGETEKLRHVIEFLSKKGDERARQLEQETR